MIPASNGTLELATFDPRRVSSLEWTQPRRGRRAWELHADGSLVATVTLRGWWKRGYAARTAGATWTISHGYLGRFQIAADDGALATARRCGIRKVEILRPGEDPLYWRRLGWLGREHRLENREGFTQLTLRRRRGFLRAGGAIALEEAGRTLPDLAPLLLLTWVLTLVELPHHR